MDGTFNRTGSVPAAGNINWGSGMVAVVLSVGRCSGCGLPLWQRYEYGGEKPRSGPPAIDPVGPRHCKTGCERPLGG
jgi:hypothetical protein